MLLPFQSEHGEGPGRARPLRHHHFGASAGAGDVLAHSLLLGQDARADGWRRDELPAAVEG